MFRITNNEGDYLYGFVGRNPIWTNRQDAKTYADLEDAENDEAVLEGLKILCWVILA